ncbi:MAG: (Fe-S)-binding protein [Opitutales bacterium]|nr:(Fe-S)-binding protein [Opitutales bacterium]
MSFPARPKPGDRRLQLMITCLCDAFYDEAARATVEVLEHLGCEIEAPPAQTCCGQPAFNAGDWPSSRRVVRHCLDAFAGEAPVVVPSGSCAAMARHGALLEFEKEPDLGAVEAFAKRTWELCDYIVNGLGVREWPGRYPAKVALHRSCHTRGTDCYESAVMLLSSIEGLELVQVGEQEQCCGFGGTFSVSFPNISRAMGQLKVDHLTAERPDCVAALDMACMMHFGGMMEKNGDPTPRRHIAEILRDALRNKGDH